MAKEKFDIKREVRRCPFDADKYVKVDVLTNIKKGVLYGIFCEYKDICPHKKGCGYARKGFKN